MVLAVSPACWATLVNFTPSGSFVEAGVRFWPLTSTEQSNRQARINLLKPSPRCKQRGREVGLVAARVLVDIVEPDRTQSDSSKPYDRRYGESSGNVLIRKRRTKAQEGS